MEKEVQSDLNNVSSALDSMRALEAKVDLRDEIFREHEENDAGVLKNLVLISTVDIGIFATIMVHLSIVRHHDVVSTANELKVLAIVLLTSVVIGYLVVRFVFKSILTFFMYVFARNASKKRIRGILSLQNEIGTRVNRIDDEYSGIPSAAMNATLMGQLKVYLKRQDALNLDEAVSFVNAYSQKNELYYKEVNFMLQKEKNLMKTLDFSSETEEEKGIRILELLRKK